jgi:hypothetical protein
MSKKLPCAPRKRSAGRPRSVRKLRSKSARIPGYDHGDRQQLAVAVADGERPRGAARRVPRGDVRRERQRADAHRVAVPEPTVHARRREPAHADEAERAEAAIPLAAPRDDRGVPLADPERRAGRLLQRLEPAGVVEVRVGVEQHLHVPDVEAELGDAADDQRGGLGVAAVDQDVARGPGEQERRDAGGADVVQVAGDPERLVGDRAVAPDRRPPLRDEDAGQDDHRA